MGASASKRSTKDYIAELPTVSTTAASPAPLVADPKAQKKAAAAEKRAAKKGAKTAEQAATTAAPDVKAAWPRKESLEDKAAAATAAAAGSEAPPGGGSDKKEQQRLRREAAATAKREKLEAARRQKAAAAQQKQDALDAARRKKEEAKEAAQTLKKSQAAAALQQKEDAKTFKRLKLEQAEQAREAKKAATLEKKRAHNEKQLSIKMAKAASPQKSKAADILKGYVQQPERRMSWLGDDADDMATESSDHLAPAPSQSGGTLPGAAARDASQARGHIRGGYAPDEPCEYIQLTADEHTEILATYERVRPAFGLLELKRLYAGFKQNQKRVTKEEFCAAFMSLSKTGTAIMAPEFFDLFDHESGGKGKMTFGDFCSFLAVIVRGTQDDRLQACFRLFDKAGNGVITRKDLTNFLSRIPLEELMSAHAAAVFSNDLIRSGRSSGISLIVLPESGEENPHEAELVAEVARARRAEAEFKSELRRNLVSTAKPQTGDDFVSPEIRNKLKAEGMVRQIYEDMGKGQQESITLDDFVYNMGGSDLFAAFLPFK